jgi:hypothetical protein
METTTITRTHHLAFRLSLALPVCGSNDGGGLLLDPDRVTCEDCRRICGLGPKPLSWDEAYDLVR